MIDRFREPALLRHGRLRILHEPIPGPLTAIAVAVRAGSRFDGAHPGIAHMAEHMLFQGTHRRDQAAINRHAGDLGGEHDADTGYEDMSLHCEVFNDDVSHALTLLAEQLFHSTVPPERFRKERRVVIDEIRGRQEDPANALHESAWARFYPGALGHPICGTIGSIRRMTPGAVRGFVARHFTPANMVVSVVGGIDRRQLQKAIATAFPARGGEARPWPSRPRPKTTGLLRLRRRDLSQTYLVRMSAAPAEARDVLALSLALEIVGADPDARLFQEVRERHGLGYDVGASVEHGPDWAVAVVSASAARAHEDRLRETVERTCREAAEGFSDDELARARKKVRFRFARLADSRLDRAVSHATRAVCGLPTLAHTARLLAHIRHHEVEEAWRRTLAAPTLTAVLAG
ncbi:MAG: insulinase family protein [bacterium]|nr:insulinase family protein [bacterium]